MIPIAAYICFAHNTSIWSAAASLFHGYIRPSSADPADETWIPALAFFCSGVTVARPTITQPTKGLEICLVGMSFSKNNNISLTLLEVFISENMSALTILTVFMDETKYGDYDRA